MKASEFIKEIEKAIKEHGDLEVCVCGDFEEGVSGLYVDDKRNYYGTKKFVVAGRGW